MAKFRLIDFVAGLPGPRRRAAVYRRIARAMVPCALLTAVACAALPPGPAEPPVLRRHLPVAAAEDVDVLAITPPMREFVARYVLPDANPRLRISMLLLAVKDKGVLGFHYNDALTLTAAEAFARRSGNCIAFANLFVALARETGLQAGYQEVQVEPEWNSRGGTLLKSKHVNVLVQAGTKAYMIDVSGQKISADSARRVMSDAEARALYFNNLGAEALIEGDLSAAYGRILRALRIAPSMSDAWSNLGVLLRRNHQPRDAELAYRRTLELDPRELAAMSNLHSLYLAAGDTAAATQLSRRVERYRRDNPYYLLNLSEEAVAAGELERAEELLRDAIRLKEKEHRLHFALAQVLYRSGRRQAAADSLAQARALAPSDLLGADQRSLEDLVFSDGDGELAQWP